MSSTALAAARLEQEQLRHRVILQDRSLQGNLFLQPLCSLSPVGQTQF